jgi:hypothetical protein
LSAVCSSYPTLQRLAVISSSDTSNIFSIYLRQCHRLIWINHCRSLKNSTRISIPPRSLMPKAHLMCFRISHIKQPIKPGRITYGQLYEIK